MKRGALSLRHGTRQQRRKKTSWGAAAASQENIPWGAATLPQEGLWGRRQRHRKGLGGSQRRYHRKSLWARRQRRWKRLGGAAWAIRSRTNTRAGQKRRPMAPNRARIWRMNEKEPDLLQFSPGSRNRVKVSTALNRHYTEEPDGYTRRVLLKLQQIAIRCIRQRGTGAR